MEVIQKAISTDLLFNQAFQLLVRILEDLGFSIKTLRIMVNSHVFFCLYMEADSAAILTNKQMKQQNKQTFFIHALFFKEQQFNSFKCFLTLPATCIVYCDTSLVLLYVQPLRPSCTFLSESDRTIQPFKWILTW